MRSKRCSTWLLVGQVLLTLGFIGGGLWMILRRHTTDAQTTVGGFLLGASLVSMLDLVKTLRLTALDARDRRHRGRDETRRLLYAAFHAAGRKADHDDWMLGGTVTNALAHHWRKRSQRDACDLGERITRGTATQEELLAVINEITAELGDAAPPAP
jgi:hypothetical protein